MVSEVFEPKRKRKRKKQSYKLSRVTTNKKVCIQPHMQARLKWAEVYIQSHRQAKSLNEHKSVDSLKYRLRTRRKAAIQTVAIQSTIQANNYHSLKQTSLD